MYRTGVGEAVGRANVADGGMAVDSDTGAKGVATPTLGRVASSTGSLSEAPRPSPAQAVTDKITNKAKQISFECMAESDLSRLEMDFTIGVVKR